MKTSFAMFSTLVSPKTLFNHFTKIRPMKKSENLKLSVCLLLFLLAGIVVSAQNANTKENAKPMVQASEGTYQLIFNSKDDDKDITLNVHELQAIEKLRKDNEVVYAMTPYSDDIRIRILPRNAVNRKGFIPAPKKYFKAEHPYEEYANIRYVELN